MTMLSDEKIKKALNERMMNNEHIGEFDDKTLDMLEIQEEYEKACATEDTYKKIDPTNPDHYKNSTSLECIEEMDFIFGYTAVIDFCVCNAWKYIRRWKNKNGVEDLKKAKWYIEKTWELMDESFAVSAKKKYSEILIRMGDYVDKYIKESEE